MATSLATLCATKPAAGHGVPIGIGTWRLAVELATPNDTTPGIWGYTKWNEAHWCDDTVWLDITSYVSGITTSRGGSSPASVPTSALATLTLYDPENSGLFAIWNAPYIAEGTPCRIVLHDPAGASTAWKALATGQIESLTEESPEAALGQAVLPVLQLIDPLADIASLDRPASTAVGAGDASGARLNRILTNASWRWPIATSLPTETDGTPAQSFGTTTLAGNALAEAQLTAFSVGKWFATDPTGAARTYARHPNTTAALVPTGRAAPWVTTFGERRTTLTGTGRGAEVVPFAALKLWRDDEATVATVALKRAAGASYQSHTGGCISGATRSYSRADLLGTLDTTVLDLAQHEWSLRDSSVVRAQIDIDALQHPDLLPLVADLDICQLVDLWREYALTATPGRLFRLSTYRVEHRIAVLHTASTDTPSFTWRTKVHGAAVWNLTEGSPLSDTNIPYPYGG